MLGVGASKIPQVHVLRTAGAHLSMLVSLYEDFGSKMEHKVEHEMATHHRNLFGLRCCFNVGTRTLNQKS